VSIPRRHIPADEWHFEYSPTENDPEYEAGAEDEMQVDGDEAEGWNNIGWWVNTSTGKRIGGKEGLVTFTVIG
jgi:DNA-directed RNA polymerase I subunit RPA43